MTGHTDNDQLHDSLHTYYVPLIHSVSELDTANKALNVRSGGRYTSELMFASAEISPGACFLTQRRYQTRPNQLLGFCIQTSI